MPLNTISDDDFRRLVKFIHGQYGIDLSQKRQLVTSRLSSLVSQQGFSSFTPFLDKLLNKQDAGDIQNGAQLKEKKGQTTLQEQKYSLKSAENLQLL